MHRIRTILVMLGVLTLGVATVAFAGTGGDDGSSRHGDRDKRDRFAKATIINAQGAKVGEAWLREERRGDDVWVMGNVRNLPPGFHGFHIHTVGQCVPPFTSAGGHYNPGGGMHPNHAGDMSTLLVNADGTGTVALATDRFSISDLRDADGSAVMVHALPDNYANIPTDRYDPDPDAMTTSTGDAGGRIACGVIR
jgi:superoxide dismutase, Cu-Zn family